MKKFVLVFLVVSAAVFQGCIFVPALDAYSQMGLSKGDRERLLGKEVKKFHDALYWGQPSEALQYVSADIREQYARDLQKDLEGKRIVESKIVTSEFKEDSYKANVSVQVRFYKVPYYVVTDRTEKELWEFTLSDGWKYRGKGEYKAH